MADTNWLALLQDEDVEGLWNSLFQLVSRHPSVRPLRFASDETAVASEFEVNADLAQELFLELFQKQRFDHYLDASYTSSEIENELTHIELPNLVGTRLRKRYPESFRMARRVSTILKTSPRFQLFDPASEENGVQARGSKRNKRDRTKKARSAVASASAIVGPCVAAVHSINGAVAPFKRNHQGTIGSGELGWDDATYSNPETEDDDPILVQEPEDGKVCAGNSKPERRRRMVNRFYGLKKWPLKKQHSDPGLFPEMVRSSVAIHRRDTRVVGRSATSQLILSNGDLEKLIEEVFQAIDSPAEVKTIRQLTLSRIPLQDYNITALDRKLKNSDNESSFNSTYAQGPPDERMTPEQEMIDEEHHSSIKEMAEEFLERLLRVVNNNSQRYDRLVKTLWYCYYDPAELSQLEIAKLLGVSDSLVSDNRKLIEYELRKLRLSLEDAAIFSEALSNLVGKRIRSGTGVAGASRSARRLFT